MSDAGTNSRFIVVVAFLDPAKKSWRPTKLGLISATCYGPFNTFEAAEAYADYKHCDDFWQIKELTIAVMSD